MAEAPSIGLYQPSVEVERSADGLDVRAEPFGPAGASSVQLPDGSIWVVDHLDPSRLVGLEIVGSDPAASPLLIAAFGADEAMRLVDEAERTSSDGFAVVQSAPSVSRRRRAWPGAAADEAGRLVVLHNLAADALLDALARVVSAVELANLAPITPGGDLLAASVLDLLGMADSLAMEVDDEALEVFGPAARSRLSAALYELERQFNGFGLTHLGRLAEQLRRAGPDDTSEADDFWRDAELVVSAAMAYEDADAYDLDERSRFWRVDNEDAMSHDVAGEPVIERVERAVIRVTTHGPPADRWVKVLRRESLVLLGQAPLRDHEQGAAAEVLVPPDTPNEHLEVRLVGVHELAGEAERPLDAMRRAVRLGRAAATAERVGDIRSAWGRWEQCSRAWRTAGDLDRARLAGSRRTSAVGRFRGVPLLADELDPYAGEVD